MIIDFQQGIITYPSSGAIQRFLSYDSGYVNLTTTDGRVDIAFAHGAENYLHTEASSVNHAWGPIEQLADAWLYFDIDALTAVRTFGFTYFQPTYGATPPDAPQGDQHWFDTVNHKMMVYRSGKWLNKIRVFAAKINNNVFSPLGNNPSKPYAGTQVGIAVPGITAGRIIVDVSGAPIRRQDGMLFTTEDEFFVNGSPVNTIRLEANVLNGTAKENVARYQVVKFSEFGKVNLAVYDDEQTTAIAMAMEDVIQGQTGTLCMQGVITNPEWNWTVVGAPLWVHGSIPGLLVDYDPHVQDSVNYKTGKPPVARVLTPTAVFFDQGLGGKGDKGDQGSANVPLATNTIFGISKLSLAAANPANPIVVGDNDPRNFNDRYPLPHSQAASTITTLPYGVITSSNMQDGIQMINDNFVKRAGDSMTGYLTLSSDPATDLHAATKHYVDTRTLDNLADVTITSPVVENVLKYDGTGWVNGPGQVAQLWMSSSRSSENVWVPATASVAFSRCDGYGTNFSTASQLTNTTLTYTPLTVVSADISVTVSGTVHTINVPDCSILQTVSDVVDYINASSLYSVVTASIAAPDGVPGITVTAKNTNATIDAFMCGPVEYAATETADDICDWTYSFATLAGLSCMAMELDDCNALSINNINTFGTYTLDIPGYVVGISVDGSVRTKAFTDIAPTFSTIGDLIQWMNTAFAAYVTVTASGLDTGFSGVIITSLQNTVTNLDFGGRKFNVVNMSNESPACNMVYQPPVAGVPYVQTTVDPILTPSPHTPAFKETFIPIRTRIDSDLPDIRIPYWMNAIGDINSPMSSSIWSVGGIAVGRPGTANGYRDADTVYVIGSYAGDETGITIEVRDANGTSGVGAGELLTANGYMGRVGLDTYNSSITAYDTFGSGIAVGNSNGHIYAMAGIRGNSGYSGSKQIVTVYCLTPDLAEMVWKQSFSLGFTDSPTGDATWFENPTAGFCINQVNNTLYVAVQTVKMASEGNAEYGDPRLYEVGVTVICLDDSGNALWNTSIYGDRNTNTWVPNMPAEVAVHESTGNVFVACGTTVTKLSNSGLPLWTMEDQLTNANMNYCISGLTVDQATGDVFFASNHPTIEA